MNRDEARKILTTWRPGLAPTDDPDVAAALECARKDPELQQWLDAKSAFDAAVKQSLRGISVPADLPGQILAARKIVRPRFRFTWRLPLAAVATVAVVILGFFFFARHEQTGPGDRADFATFRNRMVGSALREYRMDIVTNDLASIRAFLTNHQAPSDFQLHPPLANLQPVGGGLLHWQGHPVSMICLDGQELGMMFLFVAPTDSFSNEIPVQPAVEKVKSLSTAGWSEGSRAYLLASTADPAELRRMLSQLQ